MTVRRTVGAGTVKLGSRCKMRFISLVTWFLWILGWLIVRVLLWAGIVGLVIVVVSWGTNTLAILQRPSVYISVSSIAILVAIGDTASHLVGIWKSQSRRRGYSDKRSIPHIDVQHRLQQIGSRASGLGDTQSSVLVPAQKKVADWGASDTQWSGVAGTDFGKS